MTKTTLAGLSAAAVLATVVVVTAQAAVASPHRQAHSASLAGRWRFVQINWCDRSQTAAADLCTASLGKLDDFNWVFNAVAKKNGQFKFTSQIIATETNAGKGQLCSPQVYEGAVFNGSCSFEDDGTGVIKPGYGGLDFWIKSEHEVFHRYPRDLVVNDPSGRKNYPIDLFPAKVGFHDTTDTLRMFELMGPTDTAPDGIYLTYEVDHSPR